MTERTCATYANCNGRVCTVDGFIMGGAMTPHANTTVRSEQAEGRRTWASNAPNCGGQIDRINKGNVFICEKGKPLMREVRYYCRHCDSTVIFLKRCEPKEVDHD